MKRRTFLKKTALGLAAAGAMPMCNFIPSKPEKDKLGIALVGLGNYSTQILGPGLQETKHCYLAGIVTGTPEKEGVWADRYQIPESNIYNYDNFDEIADNKDIDVVYVVLPNSMHAEYTIRALQAGKHVTCEKPMATSYADCVKMVDAAKKTDRQLSIGYRLHYEPHNLELMRLGQKEVYGPVTEIDAAFGFPLRDKTSWRLDKILSGGGPLMDVGIYALQGTIYTLGKLPKTVKAEDRTKNKTFYGEVEGSLAWELGFDSGVKTSMYTTYEDPYIDYLKAKTASTEFGLEPCFVYGGQAGSADGKTFDFQSVNQQALQMDAFALNIMQNTPSLVPGEMGARDMFIIDRIYESMITGKEVSLAGVPEILHLV